MQYSIRFPIGDWSGDGHGHCEWFTVLANKPVSDIRAAHWNCQHVFGFTPGSLCMYPNESYPKSHQTISLFKQGIHLPDRDSLTARILLNAWLRMLIVVDPELDFEVVEECPETITYHGFDGRGRHLAVPGYGLLATWE